MVADLNNPTPLTSVDELRDLLSWELNAIEAEIAETNLLWQQLDNTQKILWQQLDNTQKIQKWNSAGFRFFPPRFRIFPPKFRVKMPRTKPEKNSETSSHFFFVPLKADQNVSN